MGAHQAVVLPQPIFFSTACANSLAAACLCLGKAWRAVVLLLRIKLRYILVAPWSADSTHAVAESGHAHTGAITVRQIKMTIPAMAPAPRPEWQCLLHSDGFVRILIERCDL